MNMTHRMDIKLNEYHNEWKQLRRMQWQLWGCIPAIMASMAIIIPLINAKMIPVPVAIFVPLFFCVAFLVQGVRYAYWKCPRCKNNFFQPQDSSKQIIPLTKVKFCSHCGLRKYGSQ